MNKMNNKNSGVSLTILIITIIVMIIIATVVIVVFTDTGIIDSAHKSKYFTDVSNLKDNYKARLVEAMAEDVNMDESEINANSQYGDLEGWIPGITDEYSEILYIEDGVIKADGTVMTDEEKVWTAELDIEVDDDPIRLASSDDWTIADGTITAYTKTQIVDGETVPCQIPNDESFAIPNVIVDATTGIKQVVRSVGDGINPIIDMATYGVNIAVPKLIIPDNITIKSYAFIQNTGSANSTFMPKEFFVGDNVCVEINALSPGYAAQKIIIGDNVTYRTRLAYSGTKEIIIGDNFNYRKDDEHSYYDNTFGLFSFYNLEQLVIGDNATIDMSKFGNRVGSYRKPARISIGENLTAIGYNLGASTKFEQSYISDFTIGSIKNAVDYAFKDCPLESVKLSDDGIIGKNVFNNCAKLTTVEIGNTSIATSSNLFVDCNNINKAIINTGSATNIGAGVFSNVTSITEVEAKDNATIAPTMFMNCTGITSISLANENDLKARSFENCTGLNTINFGHNAIIRIGVFAGCTSLTEIIIPADVNLSNAQVVFKDCTGLTKAVISDGITVLGSHMFYGCSNLDDITLPSDLTTLNHVYNYCSGITEIVVPSTVTSLSQEFQNCPNLKYVYIPESVKSMDQFVFNMNTGLNYKKAEEKLQIRINMTEDQVKSMEDMTGYNQRFGLSQDTGYNIIWKTPSPATPDDEV